MTSTKWRITISSTASDNVNHLDVWKIICNSNISRALVQSRISPTVLLQNFEWTFRTTWQFTFTWTVRSLWRFFPIHRAGSNWWCHLSLLLTQGDIVCPNTSLIDLPEPAPWDPHWERSADRLHPPWGSGWRYPRFLRASVCSHAHVALTPSPENAASCKACDWGHIIHHKRHYLVSTLVINKMLHAMLNYTSY